MEFCLDFKSNIFRFRPRCWLVPCNMRLCVSFSAGKPFYICRKLINYVSIFKCFSKYLCAGRARRRLPRHQDVDPPGPVHPGRIQGRLRREEAPNKSKGLQAAPGVIEAMGNLGSQVPLGRLFEKLKMSPLFHSFVLYMNIEK